MNRILITLLLAACDAPLLGTTVEKISCEEKACSYVAECSRLTTGIWDWRSEKACLASFSCGNNAPACLDAVMSLPCLEAAPSWDDIEDHTWAMVPVKETCSW